MVPSASSNGNAPHFEGHAHNWLRPDPGRKVTNPEARGRLEGPHPQEIVDFLRHRQAAAGAEGPAAERRGRIGITENSVDVALRPPEASRREAAPKHVPGPRA